ncbi:MAG: hypothetical protein AB7V60_04820 [Candidatus Caldatribacteriota bacterium]|nr:hypothetical protein [Atribacterota bacterium]
MGDKKICPACGSEEIYETKKTIKIKEPFAGEESIVITENICLVCESKGDFFDQNEEIIENTIKRLKQKSVENILKHFIENKRSLSSIERALEIPQRTLAKWKNKISKTSAAGIALLRFIRLFPWLLEVAENKYDPQKAENIMLDNVMQKLQKMTSAKIFFDTQEGEEINAESESFGLIREKREENETLSLSSQEIA